MNLKFRRNAQRIATLSGVAISASLLTVTQALAWGGSWNGPGGGGAGDINFSSVRDVSYNLTVIDSLADGYCTQTRLIYDRPYWTDVYHASPLVCGNQTAINWSGSYNAGGGISLRSVKIEQCRLHSDYSGRSCSVVKTIDNPLHS